MFELFHRLLALYEPHDAVLWLTNPQPLLDDKCPCDLLLTQEGYQRVRTLIEGIRDGTNV